MIGPLGMDLDARGFIERFRANYVNLRNLWSIGGDKPPDTELLDPKTHPIMVIEDDRGLPEPDQLFTMSRTLTLNTSDEVSLLTELWVGRIAKTAQRRG
jgi:hypothetical protein